MSSCETVLSDVGNFTGYVNRYPREQRSAAIELLISKAIAFMFHLPFFTSETNDLLVVHKVVWNGRNETAPICGPGGASDTNLFARHIDFLVEITLRTGANQWKLEFAPALRHMQEYIAVNNKSSDEVYLLLIAPQIHQDTYNSIRHKLNEGSNIIPLKFNNVEKIAQVCNLSIGLRHIDLKHLFDKLARKIMDINNLPNYEATSEEIIDNWRKDFLRNDRFVFLGIKGYRVFKERQREIMTASDIFTELSTKNDVKLYFDITEQIPDRKDMVKGMLELGFAYETGVPLPDPILSIASELEIEKRLEEILQSIKQV